MCCANEIHTRDKSSLIVHSLGRHVQWNVLLSHITAPAIICIFHAPHVFRLADLSFIFIRHIFFSFSLCPSRMFCQPFVFLFHENDITIDVASVDLTIAVCFPPTGRRWLCLLKLFLWLSFHNNCMRSKEIQNELFYVFFCFVIFPFSSFTLCVFQFSYFGFFSFRLFILFSSFIPSIDGHSRYDILTYQNGCLTIHEAKTAAYKKIASFMHTLAHSRISVFNEENRKEQKKKKQERKTSFAFLSHLKILCTREMKIDRHERVDRERERTMLKEIKEICVSFSMYPIH